jgi:MoaA/NifB/PqqE/SkfB family radical SAM enzyme
LQRSHYQPNLWPIPQEEEQDLQKFLGQSPEIGVLARWARTTMSVLDQVLRKTQKARIPFWMHLDLTYRCHQRCLHCYIPEAWRQGEGPGPELSTGQVKVILDQLAAAGTFFLTLSGGEIFLRPDLLELVQYARRLGFAISLMTSGTYGLQERELDFLKDLGLNGLLMTLFSLDQEVHDRITGMAGSWSILQQTIETGKALGLPLVLNCTALGINYSGIPKLKDYALAEGIPVRLDVNLSPRWNGRPHPAGLALTPEQQQYLIEEVGVNHEDNKEWAAHPEPGKPSYPGCGAGENLCYITPQGEIWPCMEVPWPVGRCQEREEFSCLWEHSTILQEVRRQLGQLDESHPRLCDWYRSKAG